MPITPAKAAELNDQRHESEYKTYTDKIDKELQTEYYAGKMGGVCIYTRGVSQVTVERVKKVYGELGWNVVWEGDQRDGDYLRFTPKGR